MSVTSSHWMALRVKLMLAFAAVSTLPFVLTTTVVAQVTSNHLKAEAINNQAGDYITLSNTGLVYRDLGHYLQGIDYIQRALALAQSVSDRAGEELILRRLASGSTATCSSTPYQFLSVASSPDNRRLISIVSQFSFETGLFLDYQIKQWNLVTGEEAPLLFAIPHSLFDSSQGFTKYYFLDSAVFAPDGRTLVGAYYDSVYSDVIVKSWQVETGTETRTLQIHFDSSDIQVEVVQLSSDGNTLIRYGFDAFGLSIVTLWDLASNRLIRTVQFPSAQFPSAANSAAVSLDNQTIAIQAIDHTINVQNLSNGRLIQTVDRDSDTWDTLALSSDGRTLIVNDRHGSIQIFNTVTGQLVQTLESINPTTGVPFLILSADNSTLLTGDDGEIQQWDVVTGRLIHTLCIS